MSSSPLPAYATRSNPAKLFETRYPETDPEGLITNYLDFEFHRFKLEDNWLITGNLHERFKILYWYLAAYGERRKTAMPLSAAQLRFLNSPAPVLGIGAEMTVAAYSFILSELKGKHENLTNPDYVREVIYWWCCQRSPQFCPNGELITSDQADVLGYAGPEDDSQRFGLNYFVRRSAALDETLARFRLEKASHRAALLSIMLLRSMDYPYISQFLPRRSVFELLTSADTEPAVIESIFALATTASPARGSQAKEAAVIRRELERRLATAGYPLSRVGYSPTVPITDAGPCHPRGDASYTLEKGIAVIGPFQATSGLGQATRLSLEVLDRLKRAPTALDFSMDNPAPVGFASKIEVRKWTEPKAINLIHLNAESIPLAFAYLDSNAYDSSYNIGYFFWELSEIPKCHALALEMLDEIWVSSEYNREIYAKRTSVPVINVGMAVEGLPKIKDVSRERFDIGQNEFVFLTTFDSFSFVERKNPLGVVEAFLRAFPRDSDAPVRLVIKTQNRRKVFDPHQVGIWKNIDKSMRLDPRITLIDETLSYAELLGLKNKCDAYVSLHRSEGWGFGMVEAMQLGLPVIATAYSGNMEFCSPENSYLVPYDLIAPRPSEYIFVERGSLWADPDLDEAARCMREVFVNRSEAKERGSNAIDTIKKKFSIEAISRRYAERLEVIDGLIGQTPAA